METVFALYAYFFKNIKLILNNNSIKFQKSIFAIFMGKHHNKKNLNLETLKGYGDH